MCSLKCRTLKVNQRSYLKPFPFGFSIRSTSEVISFFLSKNHFNFNCFCLFFLPITKAVIARRKWTHRASMGIQNNWVNVLTFEGIYPHFSIRFTRRFYSVFDMKALFRQISWYNGERQRKKWADISNFRYDYLFSAHLHPFIFTPWLFRFQMTSTAQVNAWAFK